MIGLAAVSPSLSLVGVAGIVLLLGCSAFFSSSEIAVFSVERYRISALVEGGSRDAALLEALRADPHRLLVTILVGNNVANIAMSSIATALLVGAFPAGVAVTAATVLLTVTVLVFGEIVPKSYGVGNAESWALRTAPTLRAFERAIGPVVTAFDAATRRLSAAVGGEASIEAPYVSRDELAALARSAERFGTIDTDEREMLEAVLALREITAGDVMVPRENVVAVAASEGLRETAARAAAERVTRLPVYRESLDEIAGIVDLRDVERSLALGETVGVGELAARTVVAPPGEPIDALLARMQDSRVQMAIVVEGDSVVGLVTVQDVLEEIVGDLLEAGAGPSVRPVEGGLIVRGDAFLDRIDGTLGTALRAEAPPEVETLSGFIYARLGRVPRRGERIRADGATITVEQVDGRRIRRMFVELSPGSGAPRD
jgi:CBS domain containing-hemolysin-like protein